MKLVRELLPLNLFEEKEKLLATQNSNPQFAYVRAFEASELQRFGQPTEKIFLLANEIVSRAFLNKTETDLFALEGPHLSQEEVTAKTETHVNNYFSPGEVTIEWSNKYTSRTAVDGNGIYFRLPCDFREEGFKGMLFHEIDTHMLRHLNYRQQPWFRKKSQYGFSDYLQTEEGLAVLHGQIPHSNKLLYIAALRVIAVWHAQNGSFLDVWNALSPWVHNLERRWIICSRVKRGLIDTSQPGGFTKDHLYLSGAVSTYDWLTQNSFDITHLYFGKLAAEDVPKALELNPNYHPTLPGFFTENQELYSQKLEEIAMANNFASIIK